MNTLRQTFLIALLASNVAMVSAQYNKENLALDDQAGNKYRFKNLQLYLIRANKTFEDQHRSVGNHLTLKEALEKKKIVITEAGNTSSGATVNTLYAQNVSADTIMILAGEVVQGGKQDRMIGQDIVLYPKSGKKDISVFCVEQGRWRQNGNGMTFNQYFSISNNEVRKAAAVKKDQREVWDKVAETTGKNNARTSSGTLVALKDSENLTKDLAEYNDHFKNLLASERDVIGVIAVSGDVILGCDMFATHSLFEKHYVNLINAYATEAITNGKPVTVPREKVHEYLLSIIEDESRQDAEVEKKGTQLKDKNRKLHISTF